MTQFSEYTSPVKALSVAHVYLISLMNQLHLDLPRIYEIKKDIVTLSLKVFHRGSGNQLWNVAFSQWRDNGELKQHVLANVADDLAERSRILFRVDKKIMETALKEAFQVTEKNAVYQEVLKNMEQNRSPFAEALANVEPVPEFKPTVLRREEKPVAKKRHRTQQEIKAIIAAYQSGRNGKQIVADYGLNNEQAMYYILDKNNIPRRSTTAKSGKGTKKAGPVVTKPLIDCTPDPAQKLIDEIVSEREPEEIVVLPMLKEPPPETKMASDEKSFAEQLAERRRERFTIDPSDWRGFEASAVTLDEKGRIVEEMDVHPSHIEAEKQNWAEKNAKAAMELAKQESAVFPTNFKPSDLERTYTAQPKVTTTSSKVVIEVGDVKITIKTRKSK